MQRACKLSFQYNLQTGMTATIPEKVVSVHNGVLLSLAWRRFLNSNGDFILC